MCLDELAKKYDLYHYTLGDVHLRYNCYRFTGLPQTENAALIWYNSNDLDKYAVCSTLALLDNVLFYRGKKIFYDVDEIDKFIEDNIIPQYKSLLKEYKKRMVDYKLNEINGDFDDIQ